MDLEVLGEIFKQLEKHLEEKGHKQGQAVNPEWVRKVRNGEDANDEPVFENEEDMKTFEEKMEEYKPKELVKKRKSEEE